MRQSDGSPKDGMVIGSLDGSVSLPQREHGFIAPIASTGSTWIKQRDGMIHAVFTLDASAAYNKQVSSDFTAARIRYNDDATTMSVNLQWRNFQIRRMGIQPLRHH